MKKLAFLLALIALTSARAATPTAVWEGNKLTDGNAQNGMTLRLNGNTSANGVVTISSLPVYIETGMTSSSPHAGTEATVVVTWENVSPSTYGAIATFTTASQTDAVGVENFGYSGSTNNQFYWIKDSNYSGWSSFYSYPNDLASHKVAFACASPTSGTGSGGYNGSAIAVDGALVSSTSSITASGNCITRINVAGYQTKYPQTGARITRIAVYNSALSTEDLAKVTGEDEPEPEEEVVWGNVGNESTAGVATTVALKAYSSLTVDFGATDNISQAAIGNDGSVKITKVRLFADNNASAMPSAITISQGDVEVTSDSCSFVSSQKIYGAYWPATSSHYWTRKAIDATFTSETQFDTTKPITISFDETTLVGIQPANSVCVGSSYTPAIEITGVYEELPDTPTYAWNKFCEDTAYTSTALEKAVTAGKQIKLAFEGDFAESDLYGAQILFYSGDSNDIYLTTDSNGYVMLTLNRKTSEDVYMDKSDTVLTAGTHQFGMLVRRGANGSGHTVSIVVTMDGKELVRLGDGSLIFDTNPMRRIYFGDSYKANNSYTAYYVEPENGVDDDVNTVATLVTDVKVLFKNPGTGPIITKDEDNHTWVVDTTYGAYAFTSDDITDLCATKWTVTLKSQSKLGATINFGERTGSQPSHFIFESGTHNFTWIGTAKSLNFNKTGTGDDPSILVKSGATLNFTARDITGWEGAATAKYFNVIRVNEGGTLNLLMTSNGNTHYYQGRYWLDPGATLNADSYSSNQFRLNGGATENYEQLYVPNTTNGAPAAVISAANGLYLASNTTPGLGVFVGENARLDIDADVSSDGSRLLTKWGAGTLALNGALAGYSGALTINAGTLKLPQNSTMAGGLAMAAGTVLDIAYDGLPSVGTVLFTATGGIEISDDAVVKVNGEDCVYGIVDNTIVFGHAEVVVPAKNLTYEPKVNATPTGWFSGFNGEPFTAAGQFRLGPGGECFSVVSSGQHPYNSLESKSNYTMALYADISQMAYDKTGRYMLDLGSKNSGINQGLLMTQNGNVQLYQANKTTVQYTLTTTNPPAAGYHLFVWTQSTANGGALYIDGERVGTIPEMTSATSAGFQIGNMHGGVWDGNYSQGIGMAVAAVYGWGQVLSPAQVALLAEQYPPVLGGIEATGVSPSISGTLNLVNGDTIASGDYSCAISVAYGATVDITYDGEVVEGAQILSASSISADNATFTINGDPLPPGFDMDTSDGRLVIGKQKVTKLLNPLAVKEGDALKVSCNAEAAEGEAAKAYDGNLSTYFAPGSAANALGVSWTGIEFSNSVIVTRIAYVSNKEKRVIGGAFQGANQPDFSDAENMHVVVEYTSGGVDVTLDEAKGPYKYLRFIGMYGGDIKEIAYYGLADSGALAPAKAPEVEGWSDNGVANVRVTADESIPQVFVVQRAMRNFCDPDGSDYETCASLAPQVGETMTWTDRKPTGYAMYRVKGFNANGESAWTYFEIEPEKLINGPAAPSFAGNMPGFYDETASVEITYPVQDAKIYYTTDGSTPTINSTLYTGAITLEDVCGKENDLVNIRPNPTQVTDSGYKWIQPTANQPNVNVIRARAFLPDGSASSNDVAGTWMVGPTANEHKLRVISIQTDRDNFFSDPTGILVPGDVYNTKGWPGGTVGSPNANYFQHGDDWERPAQIEIFDTDRSEMLAAPMGTRVRGNWSRAAAKKSLTCYFRKEYGVKNAKIKLFNDEKKMKFKRFIVRNGGNDWYKFGYRDAIGQSIFRGYVSTGTQGFEPGLLYINGEYWGLYNLRHCYSKHHFEEWNGGVGDDIDYVKMSPDDGNHFEVQEGDLCAMWNIMQYMITCTEDGVMDDDEYAYVESQIDIADMIDYYIVNVFLGNNDWNGNNMGYWRNRRGDDQKWHFTVYDCDSAMSFGGDSYSSDHIQTALNANDTDESATRMVPGFFKRCFKNAGFRQRFANRYADLLNTALKAERATNVVAQVAETVRHELPRNIDRWLNIGSEANWNSQLATVTKFFYKRQAYVFEDISDHCGNGARVDITLDACEGNGSVKLNTITSGKEFELPFTGTYFDNIPVTLTATPDSGNEFAGWKIDGVLYSTEETIELTPTAGVTVQAVFTSAGANPQQALRIVEIYGSTNIKIDPEGNTGEFVVITNTSDQVVELAGLKLVSEKVKKGVYTTTLTVEMADGQVPAYGSCKLEQKTLWPDDLTRYISNGEIQMTIADSDGMPIQVANTKFADAADGEGASMLALTLENPSTLWAPGPIHDVPPEPEEDIVLTGHYHDGTSITLEADTTIVVSNATFDAALNLTGAFTATIRLPEGSYNVLPQIKAEGALVIEGDGEVLGVLSLDGGDKLVTCAGLTVNGGVLALYYRDGAAETCAAELTGSYIQNGGIVRMELYSANEVYGFYMNKKSIEVKILGGEFDAVVDAGAKSATFKLCKGSNDATLGGGSVDVVLRGDGPRFIQTKGKIRLAGATVAVEGGDATNARVFKSAEKVDVSGGTIDGDVMGEGSEVFSSDDEIVVSGGLVRVWSSDDCFSAQTNIVVSGGIVYGHSVSNDVFDSNGQMTISGGTIIAYTLAEGHEAFDTECYPDNGLDHTFTITGGTIVGLGGKNAAWPTACDFQQETYTGTGLDPAAYSDRYLVVDGEVETLYAWLPKIDDDFILLATVKGLAGDPTVSDTCPVPDPIAEDVPAWRKLKNNQQSLRFAEIYGNTSDGTGGDTGEYFVLTNVSANVVYLRDLEIEITKSADKKSKSKCNFKVTGDPIVEPYGSYTFEQATWGWTKITNGDLRLVLTDADGKAVQSGETSNDFYPECDGNGASLVAKTFEPIIAMTTDDWEPSFRWYYFTTDGETSTITGFGTDKLAETTLTLPRELGKVPVSLVAENAFVDCALTTLKVTLTNETLKVMKTEGAAIAQYDMSESEGELVLGYALDSALNVSGSVVLGSSAATLAFDLGEGVTQEINGTTDDVAKQYGIVVYSGTLNFTKSGGDTSFRGRTVTADGENAVVRLGTGDATGYTNPGMLIALRNGARLDVSSRDTLCTPVELDGGKVRFLVGCGNNGSRALDLFNNGGNSWKVLADSSLAFAEGASANDRKILIRRGDWNVDVAADSLFTVEPSVVASAGNTSTVGNIVKTGAGTLYLAATDNTYATETVVYGGTLKLAQSELAGSLTMAAGTALDLHYDGIPTHGTVVLSAASLNLSDDVAVTVDGVPYAVAKSGTALTVQRAVAQVGGKAYGTIVEAAKAAGDGGVMTLLLPYDDLKDEIDAAAITLTPGEGSEYTNNYKWAVGTSLIISEIMPKPTDGEYDVNGLASGWVALLNTTNAWVNLKDYKFIRANRSKANGKGDFGNFPSEIIGPSETYRFLTSERYGNSADKSVSAFEHGTFDGKPVKYGADLNNVMVWGDKVNPKKFCFVRFSYNPAGGTEEIVDTVVIPSDLPESWSIVVDPVETGVATTRWMQPRGSDGEILEGDRIKIGPNAGPLYEIQGGKSHKSASEFARVSAPADTNENYQIVFAMNPTMSPTEQAAFRDEDQIASIKIVYRVNLDDATLETNEVDLATREQDATDWGDQYTAEIPKEDFASIGPGRLIQWKFLVTDASGNTWTTPSFNNPDDGYEWYGTITEPGDLNSASIPTWHMFADEDSLAQMDTDADEQTLPNNARVGIYDASTSNYYDYVRIDLRGQTSAGFAKKSHGFRFAKAHPLTMRNVVTGKDIKEIRKTSLIGEPADPSYMRQMMAFWLLNRVGTPAPFDFPTRANLNGQFYQLAFNSERFTDELIEDVHGLDKYGYSYKNVGALRSGRQCEKKTPDDGNESDNTVLQNELRAKITAADMVGGTTEDQLNGIDATGLDNAALTKFVVQKFNLPAWLNYLAVTRITQEMDDVWANLGVYYDNPEMKEGARGTGTWMPIAYDMNLSFGQHYKDSGVSVGGVMSNQDWFKSHPFYGGNRVRCYKSSGFTGTVNYGNNGFESVWQNAKFRRLYLRRLRTLMDQELKAPGTDEADVPVMAKMRELAELMRDDTLLDKQKWPHSKSGTGIIDPWGSNWPATMDLGIQDIWDNYIVPRRTHFYVTHAITNTAKTVGYGSKCNAGIPEAQSPIADLKAGFSATFDVESGLVAIRNANDEVVDMSGWTLGGPMVMTLPAGTVVDSNDCVYIVADRRAYVTAIDADITSQVIVGNATLGADPMAAIVLSDANGTPVIAPETKSDQEKYLRLWGFCGAPDKFDEDKGEFFILTNFNQSAALDVGGVDLNFCGADKLDSESKCHIVLNAGLSIPAGGWLRICLTDTDKFTGTWSKIANHQQRITILDGKGVKFIYFECVDQDALGVYCNGYALRYDFPTETWQRMLISEMPGSGPEPEPVKDLVFTGDYPTGATVALTNDTTVIVSNATFGAALTFTSNFVATIRVPEGTASRLPKIAATEASLVFEGEGTTTVSNSVKLIDCAGLTVKGGTLNLDLFGTMSDTLVAAEMTGSYLQQGGTVNLRMNCTNTGKKPKSLYGFRWKDKPGCTATIEKGGEFNAELYNDSNAVAFKANDPSNAVTFDGAALTGSFTGKDGRMVDTKGTLTIKGGTTVDIENETDDTSVFKADGLLAVKKATVRVNATGVGSKVFSSEDSIEAGHDNLVLYLVAQDRCFNAETNIVFSKGVVYAQATAGNVFSTNATLTVKGGTIVALGGEGGILPNVGDIQQSAYTNLACAAEDWSEKYLVIKSETSAMDVTTTVEMPTLANPFSMFVTTANMAGDPAATTEVPSVEPIATNVPVWVEKVAKTFQENLRFYEIYGNTTEGSGKSAGDVGEYFVLTNVSAKTVSLKGLKINIGKKSDCDEQGPDAAKVKLVLAEGTVEPYGSVKFKQSDFSKDTGWDKITNGDLYLLIRDAADTQVQKGYTSNKLYPQCDGKGASLIARTFGVTIESTKADWKPSYWLPTLFLIK